ncbi:MAG TPA: hypothetical protein VMF30_09290, partial [Pirellulales bacterium]|nr:hypothetical protein [Pirellulales bacterium]
MLATAEPSSLGLFFLLLVGIGLLCRLAMKSLRFGRGVVVAILLVLVVPVLLYFLAFDIQRFDRRPTGEATPISEAMPAGGVADDRLRQTPEPLDPAIAAFTLLLSEHATLAAETRPAWIDEKPALVQGVYRRPVKSGLYSTDEECRQALAVAIADAAAGYAQTLLADPDATALMRQNPRWLLAMQHDQIVPTGRDLSVLRSKPPQVAYPSSAPAAPVQKAATGGNKLISEPIFIETAQRSVGPMHEMHALLEFDDAARGHLRESWRQVLIPGRIRWVAVGYCA